MVTLRGLGLLLIFSAFVNATGQDKPPSTIANSGQGPSRKLNSTADVQSIVRSRRLATIAVPYTIRMGTGFVRATVTLSRPWCIVSCARSRFHPGLSFSSHAANSAGEAHFYRDIYDHDAALEEALAKGYPYPK